MDSVDGTYLVCTASGSAYYLDLTTKIAVRVPIEPSGVLTLRRDGEEIALVDILEASVGREMRILIDLHLGVGLTCRRSTEVVSIHELAEAP